MRKQVERGGNVAKDLKGKELPKGITQRPDGRYMGRFQYEGENYCVYNVDLEALINKMDDMKYELRHGIYQKEQNITVDAWFHTWMQEYKANSVKRSTYKQNEYSYGKHIKKELGKKKMKDIRPEHIQRLYNRLDKVISRSSLSNIAGLLSGMFKQAEKNGIIKKNPVPLATLPKRKEEKERRVLTEEEQGIFLEYARKSEYGDIVEFALSTGMRIMETAGLQWSDVDFKNRVIHVTKTLSYTSGEYYLSTPKTRTSVRDIPMLDNVYLILKKRRQQQAEDRMLLGEMWKALPELDNLVFTQRTGRHICERLMVNKFDKITRSIQKDGIEFERITPHTLRHTFATRCIENGMPPQVLKTILGHSKLSMTMDLYSHVLPDTKAEEMKKIVGLVR